MHTVGYEGLILFWYKPPFWCIHRRKIGAWSVTPPRDPWGAKVAPCAPSLPERLVRSWVGLGIRAQGPGSRLEGLGRGVFGVMEIEDVDRRL